MISSAFPLRAATISIGLLAALWGIRTFPIFAATEGTDDIAFRVAASEPFRRETLSAALPAEPNTANEERARYMRSLAIIRLRLTELDIEHSPDHTASPEELKKLEVSVSRALEQEPADAYLWLVMSWLKSKSNEPPDASLAALRMSYLCGPNEGWVAVSRNRFVLSHFAAMPQAIQDSALQEFRVLVASGYAKQTAEIFVGEGWPIHVRLLDQIVQLPVDAKRAFAEALYPLNDTLTVPGVILPSARHRM